MSTTADSLTVICPHCGSEVLLDEAIIHEFAAPMRAEMRQQIGREVRADYARELEAQRAERVELEERLKERDQQVTDLRAEEAKLRQERRQLEDEKDDLEREKERMRDEIRKHERADADERAKQRSEEEMRQKEAALDEQLHRSREEYAVKTRQLEDQLKRVNAQLEEAQRKSDTSQRQKEGVAGQDLFAEDLCRHFPDDLITVTPAGRRGPDVIQVVRVGHLNCGKILWECKRIATWNAEWPRKLAGEARAADAMFGVVVSEVLARGMDGSSQVGNVWACDYAHAPDLATGLRQAVIAVYRYEVANAARSGTAGKVYDYIATGGFEGRYKAMEQAIDRLTSELDQDQRVSQQRWKRLQAITDEIREQGLRGVVLDIIGLGGEIPPAARAEIPGDTPPELPAA